MKGIFVAGTDTGIGKTVVSAGLLIALGKKTDVRYWKPVQTGIEEDDDTKTVGKLARCSAEQIHDRGYRLEKPLSPHLSAELAGVEITIGKILEFQTKENDPGSAGPDRDVFWIVEGAGGLLVPLNKKDLIIDLIGVLELPVVLVSRSGLGTINHTLLSLAALRQRHLEISGVIMVGDPNPENRWAIEHFGRVRVLAEMPKFEKLDGKSLTKWSENCDLWQSLKKEMSR